MRKEFLFGKKWFFENFIPGEKSLYTWCTAFQKKIYSGKSKFQKIEIFDTEKFGRILTLDGFTQLSTKHEFIYHEMLVHPAFFYNSNPKKVLIIGGGDGGVLREVVKHKSVEEIIMADIDKKVINISKKYFPSVSDRSFQDKRLKLFIVDALNFVKKYKDYFDVVINDLTDPGGCSYDLWSRKFYSDISRALKKDGVAIFQTAYLNEIFAKKNRNKIKNVFRYFKIHKAHVSCFPFDEHSFSVVSKTIDFNKINYKKIERKYKKLQIKTKYYSPEIHFASAVLPKYLKDIL